MRLLHRISQSWEVKKGPIYRNRTFFYYLFFLPVRLTCVLGFLRHTAGTAAGSGDSSDGVAVCIGAAADADAGADEDDSADTAEGGQS